jgi:serine O-acetyltransferase
MLREDVKAKARWLYGGDSIHQVLRAWLSDATFCMVLYRLMAWCNRRIWGKPLAHVLQKLNSVLCGAAIGVRATFGKRFIVLHSVGVVINSATIAGDDVVIESGVVIGAEKGLSPCLKNNIFVGSGAKILGGITIGNNVTVGANAVVVKSIPDDVVVGGVPAKIIRWKNAAEQMAIKD